MKKPKFKPTVDKHEGAEGEIRCGFCGKRGPSIRSTGAIPMGSGFALVACFCESCGSILGSQVIPLGKAKSPIETVSKIDPDIIN